MAFQWLFLTEIDHFLLTFGIALILYWRYRDWRIILICFITGFMIDIDHLFDYFAYWGLGGNWSKLVETKGYFDQSGKIFVPFHGWEFTPLLWLLGAWLEKKIKIRGARWALSLPYLGHLFLDHFTYLPHPLAYSFIYRLLNNFSLESFDGV